MLAIQSAHSDRSGIWLIIICILYQYQKGTLDCIGGESCWLYIVNLTILFDYSFAISKIMARACMLHYQR